MIPKITNASDSMTVNILRYDRMKQNTGSCVRLNDQPLLYFWTVVRAGSLTRACEEFYGD